MKVAFFIADPTLLGGVERATINLVNALSIQGIEVHLISLNANREEFAFKVNDKVICHSLMILNYKSHLFYIGKRISVICKEFGCKEIVIVESISLLYTFMIKFFYRKINIIVWEHFNFYNNNGSKKRDYCRIVASKFADKVVTLTERDRITWVKKLKPNATVFSVPNIVDYYDEIDYDVKSKIVIAVGRLHPVKRFDLLIRIWSLCYKSNQMEGWKLKIVGDGELFNELKLLIDELDINSCVELVGSSNNIAKYYKEASFFCLTSEFEGFPMALIEAQFSGLPCIAFDIYTGPSEILSLESGIIVENNDINNYMKSILMLINDDKLRLNMSRGAIVNSQRFEKRRIVEKWRNILE